MKNYPTWKWIIVLIIISLAIVFSIPTYVYQNDTDNWFLKNKINLGLDLQGGSYLLLEVESSVLIKEELNNIDDVVRQIARKEKTRIASWSGTLKVNSPSKLVIVPLEDPLICTVTPGKGNPVSSRTFP